MTATDHTWAHRLRLTALVLAGSLAAVVIAPSTASAATVPVSVTATRTSLTLGESVRFTGVVDPAQAGRPITLQAFAANAWRNVATSTLNSRSRYTFTIKPGAGPAVRYRVRTSATPALVSAVQSVKVFPSARLDWSFVRSTMVEGQPPTITWRTSSLPKDYRVLLQRRALNATRWTPVTTLGRSGKTRIPAPRPGRQWYRAVILAPTQAFVLTQTHILTVSPLPAGCRQDVVAASVCRFVVAVQTNDPSRLSKDERKVAIKAKSLPRRPWTPGKCELVGDVTVRCDVRFTRVGVRAQPVVAGLLLQPTNGVFRDGVIVLPPGVALKYGVIDYLGVAP